MKKRYFVSIALIAILGFVFTYSVLNQTGTGQHNQDITYLVNFPAPGEHSPKILNVTFSSCIDFNAITKPQAIYEFSRHMYPENRLATLGKGFGFHMNDLKRDNYSYDWYTKPGHYLTVIGEGTFIYQNSPESVDPTKPFPGDNILKTAAEKFLIDNDLLTEGFVVNNVADGLVTELGTGEQFVEQRSVSFMRYIDDMPVYGNSRLTVSFDRELNITGVDSVHSPIKARVDTPQVRNAKDMFVTAIEKGRGLLAFDLNKPAIDSVSIVISDIHQAYWEDNDSNLAIPVFHYTGDLYNAQGEWVGSFVGIEQSF